MNAEINILMNLTLKKPKPFLFWLYNIKCKS